MTTYDQELVFYLALGKGLGNTYALLLHEHIHGYYGNMT